MKSDAAETRYQFEKIVEHLCTKGVEFIIIGGRAETLMGSARVTFDTDLCFRRTRDNLERLAAAVKELKPTLRGAPPDLPFRVDAQSFALGNNFTFETIYGPLDLLGWVEPFGTYEELLPRTEVQAFGDFQVRVIALDDLIRIKQHINRPKDRDSLMHLLAIKRIRDEQQG